MTEAERLFGSDHAGARMRARVILGRSGDAGHHPAPARSSRNCRAARRVCVSLSGWSAWVAGSWSSRRGRSRIRRALRACWALGRGATGPRGSSADGSCEDREIVSEAIAECLRAGSASCELRILRAGGAVITVAAQGETVCGDGRASRRICGARCVDVSGRARRNASGWRPCPCFVMALTALQSAWL